MSDSELERAIRKYLSRDDDSPRYFQSLTTITESVPKPEEWWEASLGGLEEYDFQEAVRAILDNLTINGVLEARMGERDYERSYRLVDLVEPPHRVQTNALDSTTWTGLSKIGFLSPEEADRLKVALMLVDDSLNRFAGTNEERAQARAYVIALHALADAPQPPADVIYRIFALAGAMAGIGSLFVALAALYK